MNKKHLIAPGVALIVAACIWADTSEYRQAAADYASDQAVAGIQAEQAAIEYEMGRHAACGEMQAVDPLTHESRFTAAGRDCLLQALGDARSTQGAMALATDAFYWLLDHSDDEELRSAVLSALERGRLALLAEKPEYFDRLDKVREAANRSWVMRLVDGPSAVSTFEAYSERLDNIEFWVRMPEAYRRQAGWRTAALGRQPDSLKTS